MALINPKANIRKEVLQRRRALEKNIVRQASDRVHSHLMNLDAVGSCTSLAGYATCENEIDLGWFIFGLLELDVQVYFPAFNASQECYSLKPVRDLKKDFVIGKYNIFEPLARIPFLKERDLARIDVWLVPGIAFDRLGNRIGWGKGYYDRLLEKANGLKIGIAYEFQIYRKLPRDPQDIQMDIIVTPSGVIIANPGSPYL